MRAMEDISRAFEWIAVGLLILAFLLAVISVARDLLGGEAVGITYRRGRRIFGRGLLISLEILVAAYRGANARSAPPTASRDSETSASTSSSANAAR